MHSDAKYTACSANSANSAETLAKDLDLLAQLLAI